MPILCVFGVLESDISLYTCCNHRSYEISEVKQQLQTCLCVNRLRLTDAGRVFFVLANMYEIYKLCDFKEYP